MPGTALLVDGFICLPLSPVVSHPGCLARLSWWTGSFVSLCLPPFVSLGGQVHFFPFVSLHLSFVVSQPRCRARLSWWTGSFVSLCLPSFVGFISLPLSPFICLPLSPSLDAWHGSLGGRVDLSRFVSLHLSPVVSQPGCLARLSWWTGSFVSLSPFICLPLFRRVSRASEALAQWSAVTGSQLRLNPNLRPLSSHAISMAEARRQGCLAPSVRKNWVPCEGKCFTASVRRVATI